MNEFPQTASSNPSPIRRVCGMCGYKDRNDIPPIMCPVCHFQEDSALAPKVQLQNRRERRAQAARHRLLMRKTNKQVAREGKIEAS